MTSVSKYDLSDLGGFDIGGRNGQRSDRIEPHCAADQHNCGLQLASKPEKNVYANSAAPLTSTFASPQHRMAAESRRLQHLPTIPTLIVIVDTRRFRVKTSLCVQTARRDARAN